MDRPHHTPVRGAGLAAALLALALTPGARAEDTATLIPLPVGALASGLSASGATVIGNFRTGGAFYWMPTTGVIFAGGSEALDISGDGQRIVGTARDANRIRQAGYWLRAAEWRLLGSVVPNAVPCDDGLSSGYGASADGRVIVGLAWNGCNFARAFRWEESTGMVDLGSTVQGRSSRANGVSGDGRVVVGWQEHATGPRQGARWIDGKQEVFTGPHGIVGEAHAANSNGSIIVGQHCNFTDALAQNAWMWTITEGVVCLPPPRTLLPVSRLGIAVATSDNGRVIGGGQSFGLESEALLWVDRESFYLKDYLRQHGVPNAFEGWVNTGFVNGVSRDGRVLSGYGAGPADFQGFIVILPELGGR